MIKKEKSEGLSIQIYFSDPIPPPPIAADISLQCEQKNIYDVTRTRGIRLYRCKRGGQ